MPGYWQLQYIGVFNCNEASAIASPKLPSWCQVSTSLHNLFSPGHHLHLKLPLHQWPSLASQCQDSATVHDPFMASKPVPPGWFLYITKSSCSRYNLGLSQEHSFFELSENTPQKTPPQWCWSLLISFLELISIYYPSTSFYSWLKPEPHGWSCWVLLLRGIGTCPHSTTILFYHQLSVFQHFSCLSLAVLELAL